jgi:L-threonylcarbamoyladenylate synthase
MEMMMLDRPHDDVIAQAVRGLRDGGVVLVPTDTVYGLAVHPEQPEAIERLFHLKGRPRSTNLPIMIADLDELKHLGVVVTDEATRLMERFCPGPITVALGVDEGLSPSWLAGRVEVAVRIPADDIMRAILAECGPLLVTSANLHGNATPETAPEVVAQLSGSADFVIDDGVRKVVPSTLVNCNLPVPTIERVGVLSVSQIQEVLPDVAVGTGD